MKENNNENLNAKLSEKISLKLRKVIMVNKIFTAILVIALIVGFIALTKWVNSLDIEAIDITKNQLYSLSDESKDSLKKIDQPVRIYLFGVSENDTLMNLIKQYSNSNDFISYEILTSDTNLSKIEEFDLSDVSPDEYKVVILETDTSNKVIDTSAFTTYDSSYQTVDVTEQTLTNSIVSLTSSNKTKVYFSTGHSEYTTEENEGYSAELGVLVTYLKNEAFQVENINLMTISEIPEDCNVLAIMAPETDFFENETQLVLDYINKGGNLFITQDYLNEGTSLPNFQKILDQYGVSVDNGYVIETDSERIASNYPYVFIPQMSENSKITADINTYNSSMNKANSSMWFVRSPKIGFATDETLQNLNVTHDDLITSSESAYFLTDLTQDINEFVNTQEGQRYVLSSLLSKKIESTEENVSEISNENDENQEDVENSDEVYEDNSLKSELIIVSDARYISDYIIPEFSSQYPLSYLNLNRNFTINAISYLGSGEDGLSLPKGIDTTVSSYTPTDKQKKVVIGIIISIPLVVLAIGTTMWTYRRKRK